MTAIEKLLIKDSDDVNRVTLDIRDISGLRDSSNDILQVNIME